MGISVSILVVLVVVLAPLLRKWIVEYDRFITETEGRRIDFWGRIVLAIAFFISLFFVKDSSDETTIKWFLIIFYTIFAAFQFIIEWKYLKNTKEFIITLLLWLFVIIYFFVFIL
ncbi:hypothetical protein A8F94_01150 [Bacillus sp. FJAT-27225]|uniref:DUF4181 domain-containing protein n=1 Tax=Bacillus sp. FJAT-27225 TaxID=1743144 RepID=UPI00080C240C|nr:DUF4181 domain-containing protein [Bacillus sp. FJAT-27225]OCA90522.1 hypothetical protein A8F94_01150 [Bacillus sp. FJAT-27225]